MKLKDEILFELMSFVRRSGHEVVIPNFYFGRYEMDLFRLLSTGYVHEYEIKTSRADFRSDFKKKKSFDVGMDQPIEITKHDEISLGKYKANKFFFVVPDGLVTPAEIPEKCGLIYYLGDGRFKTEKPAKFLNKNPVKVDHQELNKRLCFREWNIRQKNYLLTKKQQKI